MNMVIASLVEHVKHDIKRKIVSFYSLLSEERSKRPLEEKNQTNSCTSPIWTTLVALSLSLTHFPLNSFLF